MQWLCAFLLSLLLPLLTLAQSSSELIVSLRDIGGQPMPGVVVTVRDPSGARDLAYTSTDAQGQALFAALPLSQVRLVCQGTLADGTPLAQRGDDAQGILVFLDAGATRIELRAEKDGAVLPDPATMVAASAPDAPDPATQLSPSLRPTSALAQSEGSLGGPAITSITTSSGPAWAGYALVAALALATAAVLLWGKRI